MKTWIFLIVYASLALSVEALANTNSADKSEFNRIYREYKSIADTDDYERQLVLLEQSLELGKKLFDSPSKSVAALYHSLANLRAKNAQNRKALLAYKSALNEYQKIYGKWSIELVDFLLDFGDFSIDPGGIEPNKSFYKRALGITRKKHGSRSTEYAKLQIEVGNRKLLNMHSFPFLRVYEARRDIEKGYKLMSKLSLPQSEEMLFASVSLAKLRLNEGRKEEALSLLESSLQLSDRYEGDSSESSLSIHGYLANTYSSLGKTDEATKHCRAISSLSPVQSRQSPRPVVLYNSAKTDWTKNSISPKSGYVDLVFDVDESGFVDNIEVVGFEGMKAYTDEAMRLASQFRYAPAIINGEFVRTSGITYRMDFKSNVQRALCQFTSSTYSKRLCYRRNAIELEEETADNTGLN